MELEIYEIAQVYSGYQFRSNQPQLPSGNWKYIQMRDIDSNNIINEDTVISVDLNIKEDSVEKYQLNNGDILFKNRGAKNNAAVFKLIWHQAIASHQFLIIRIIDSAVIPEYIAWFLNSKHTRSYFKQKAAGTDTLLIQKKTLEELKIVIPDINIQKSIVKIERLRITEKNLVKRKMRFRDKYVDKILSDFINSERNK